MDAALARAARIRLRGNFLFAEPATAADAGNWRRDRATGARSARVGNGPPQKKRCPGCHGPVRLHTQSALSWQLSDRTRLHHSFWKTRFGNSLRGIISGHLCSRDARRIGHARGIVWGALPKILESSAVVFAAAFALPRWNARHSQLRRFTV